MHERVDRDDGAAGLARRPAFRLGEAIVTPALRRVEGPGGTAMLEPRVMQVLVHLADAAGAVVTRQQLIDACWAGRVVGEDAVNRSIGEVRRAAKGPGGGGFAVETIAKTGWRLTGAQPAPAEPAAPPPAAAPMPVAEASGRPSRRAVLVAGGAAALAAAGGIAWLAGPGSRAREAARLFAEAEMSRRQLTYAGDIAAVDLYRRGLALDPDNATAWGRLALVQCNLASGATGRLEDVLTDCETAVAEALRREPDQANALAARAALPFYHGDWLAARRRLLAVIARHPGQVDAQKALAWLEAATGEAAAAGRRGAALARQDARDTALVRAAAALLLNAGDLAQLGPMIADPRLAPLLRVQYLDLSGRLAAAIALLDAHPDPGGLPQPLVPVLRTVLVARETGAATDRRRAIDGCMAHAGRGHNGAKWSIRWLGKLGACDEAFAVADGYFLGRGPIRTAFVEDPWSSPNDHEARRRTTVMLFSAETAPLRADPRFLPLVTEIGLVDYWRQARLRPDFLGARPLPA